MTVELFDLLTDKMVENVDADRREATMVAANGIGIGMGGSGAYKAWLSSQGESAADPAAAAQAATIGRLRALYASQKKNSPLRNAIRPMRPN